MQVEQILTASAQRQPYQTPQLHNYGAVSDLTAGGSGNANEGSGGQRPRP
ncbi:hypothetical protein J2X06_003065 [Lysobacter niastensis]|uniref:Lasso RiPP family leader peptide-containing protein n=1 Tax=Lysobacter niastensis TaxID=380629 RepID=A0ABU1WE65_9GAMM|nr:hypothetical protein [Lysobacter niastensis]